MAQANKDFDFELDELAVAFKKNVKLEDRRFNFRKYKECFIGKEAVDYLVESGQAPNREDAVKLGQALQATYLFEHVTRDHLFADEKLFFRFLGAGERGSFSLNEKGQAIDWSNFLAPASMGEDHASLLPHFPTPDFQTLNPNDTHIASKMWPLDEFNKKLLNHVHPPNWQDPAPGNDVYDLVVLGGGTGGLISASGSAGVGARVALIEEHMLGGDW
jgi:hypothetical protein